jgi:hypothetical protein
VTHAAGCHPDDHFVILRRREIDIFYFHGSAWFNQDGCVHGHLRIQDLA